jgi:hypothetical protein
MRKNLLLSLIAACGSSLFFGSFNAAAQSPFTCTLELQWRHLGGAKIVGTHGLIFPRAEPVPGVYRFSVRAFDGFRLVYVGQSKNLRNRLQRYAQVGRPSAKESTVKLVRGWIMHVLRIGGSVDVAVLGSTRICGQEAEEKNSLANTRERMLLERLGIYAECVHNVMCLNRDQRQPNQILR